MTTDLRWYCSEEHVRAKVTALGPWAVNVKVPTVPAGWHRLADGERIAFGDYLWDGGSFRPILGKKLIDLPFPTMGDVVIRPNFEKSAHLILSWRKINR